MSCGDEPTASTNLLLQKKDYTKMFDKDMKPQLQVITGQSLGHDRQVIIFDLIISKITGNLQLQDTTLTGNIKESNARERNR